MTTTPALANLTLVRHPLVQRIVKAYEGRLPAVLEFEVYEGCTSFTLEVSGQRFTQPLPEDDDHHGEDH